MFSYRPAGNTSMGTSPTWVRSTRFSRADNCCAVGAAVVVPAKQPTRKCELGVRFRPKSAEDYARAGVRNSVNAVIPICYLSADEPSFRQDVSPGRVTGRITTYVVRSGEL